MVGAGSTYGVGATGGSNTVALTTNNLPSHNHTFSGTATSSGSHSHTATLNLSGLTTSSAGDHNHTGTCKITFYTSSRANNGPQALDPDSGNKITVNGNITTNTAGAHTHSISGTGSVTVASGGAHTHTVSGTVGNTGSGAAHENRPPYYALCYIMKL